MIDFFGLIFAFRRSICCHPSPEEPHPHDADGRNDPPNRDEAPQPERSTKPPNAHSRQTPHALTASSYSQPETLTESHKGNRAGKHTADRNGTTPRQSERPRRSGHMSKAHNLPSRSTRPRRCHKLSRYKTIIRNSAGDSHILRYSEPLPESVQMQTDPPHSRKPSHRQSNDARQTTPRKPPEAPTSHTYSRKRCRTPRRTHTESFILYRRISSGRS